MNRDHFPNDCMLLGLEAMERMKDIVPWSAILDYDGETAAGEYVGHIVYIFETPDGDLWAYDCDGSERLGKMKKRTAKRIAKRLLKNWGQKLTKARLIPPK